MAWPNALIQAILIMQAILDDLYESRQAQQAAKVIQQANMAKHEKAEFERILQVNREKQAQEQQLAHQVRVLILQGFQIITI
jgi:hypothetical protein